MGTATYSRSWGNNLTLEILSAWNKPNIASNTSTVNVQVFLKMSSYGYISIGETRPLKITVDGRAETINVNPSINYGQRKLLFAKDYIVNHNSDGNKPLFNISAYYPINFSNYGEATANQSISLPKINRLSVSSAISGVLGNAVTITINRYSTSFTHNLKYDFKGSTGTIATGVGTSYLWTIPPTFANLLPNELTGTGNLIVETMDGSAKIGETKYTLSITIPNTATYKPKLSSITLSDTNTLTSSIVSGNNFVRIISKVKVDFGSAIGNNGSTITSYNAEIVGKSNSIIGNGSVFDKLDFFGSATIRATVTDSRGLTSEPVDTKINVIDYFLPIVTSAKVVRSQQNPDILQVLPFVKIAPIIVGGIQKNQLKMSVSVAPYNTGIYAVDSGAATNTWSTISQMSGAPLNLGGTYDKSKSWLVKISVSDNLMSATPIIQPVASEFVLVTKAPSGVAFGKIWEHGIIDAKGDVYVDGTIYCGDKAIQQKPLALNNGGSFRHDDTDLNSLQDTGFYCVFRGANRPAGAGPGYVTVVRHETANYAYQQFYDRTNKTIFTRLLENGVWSGWSEYVKKDSLQTTGWITIGNGFKYKRKGDDIDLMYNFASNGLQRWSVGNMPSGLIPQELMFAITGWTLAPDKSIHLQINASGLIECINPGAYSNTYRGVVHWSI